MRIALAQLCSKPGDIEKNASVHCDLIKDAITKNADVVVFPELSITGYEPSLARGTMRDLRAWQFSEFQQLADSASITICFGAPIIGIASPRIGIVRIRPYQMPTCYSKMHLHVDELPFFEAGTEYTGLLGVGQPIGIAICYELSVPIHIETVFKYGARLLIASVAKSVAGVANAASQLKQIAMTYSCPVLMVNGIGPSENFISCGMSAVWNKDGSLITQLDDHSSGLLYFDEETSCAFES